MKIVACIYIVCITLSFSFLKQETPLSESIDRGKDIYMDFCISCHLNQGEGVPGTFPPLANSDYVLQHREKSIRAIKYGLEGEIIVNGESYNNTMPSPGLEDEEIADVMNYILHSWGNTSDRMVTPKEVSTITAENP